MGRLTQLDPDKTVIVYRKRLNSRTHYGDGVWIKLFEFLKKIEIVEGYGIYPVPHEPALDLTYWLK